MRKGSAYMENKFPKRLRALRKKRGYTQQQLGEKVYLSGASIGTYERGRYEPSVASLINLASVLGCTVDYLIGKEETGQ